MKFATLLLLMSVMQSTDAKCKTNDGCKKNWTSKTCCPSFDCSAWCDSTLRCRKDSCGRTYCNKYAEDFSKVETSRCKFDINGHFFWIKSGMQPGFQPKKNTEPKDDDNTEEDSGHSEEKDNKEDEAKKEQEAIQKHLELFQKKINWAEDKVSDVVPEWQLDIVKSFGKYFSNTKVQGVTAGTQMKAYAGSFKKSIAEKLRSMVKDLEKANSAIHGFSDSSKKSDYDKVAGSFAHVFADVQKMQNNGKDLVTKMIGECAKIQSQKSSFNRKWVASEGEKCPDFVKSMGNDLNDVRAPEHAFEGFKVTANFKHFLEGKVGQAGSSGSGNNQKVTFKSTKEQLDFVKKEVSELLKEVKSVLSVVETHN